MSTNARTNVVKLSFISVIGIIVTAAITAGITYSASRPEVTSLIDIDSITKNVFPIQSENIDIETFSTNTTVALDNIAHIHKK